MVQILCVHMYVNGKMIPIESIPGMGEGVNSSMIYLIYCKSFCRCHNVCPTNTIIKNKNEK
jgi:flavoprotein